MKHDEHPEADAQLERAIFGGRGLASRSATWGQEGRAGFVRKAQPCSADRRRRAPRGSLGELRIMQYLCKSTASSVISRGLERAGVVDSAMFYLIGPLYRSSRRHVPDARLPQVRGEGGRDLRGRDDIRQGAKDAERRSTSRSSYSAFFLDGTTVIAATNPRRRHRWPRRRVRPKTRLPGLGRGSTEARRRPRRRVLSRGTCRLG